MLVDTYSLQHIVHVFPAGFFLAPHADLALGQASGISSAIRKIASSLALPLAATALAAFALAKLFSVGKRFHPAQVAVITGASRGLGLALAHRFGRAGLKLVLAARDPEELQQAREGLLQAQNVLSPNNILLVPCDLTDPKQAAGLVRSALDTFGRIDLLINNAGTIEVGPFENQPLEAYARAMRTGFFAALHTVQAAIPALMAPPDESFRGIVNISSIGGKLPAPHLLPYIAANFALNGFSEGLHTELRHKGIRVTTVCPGLMRTGGERHAHSTGHQTREARWFKFAAQTPGIAASVAYAAERIYKAVQSGSAEITITPQAGLAPESTQTLVALANQYPLPAPVYTATGFGANSALDLP